MRQLRVPFLVRQQAQAFTLLSASSLHPAVWKVKAAILVHEKADLALRMSLKEPGLLKILWSREDLPFSRALDLVLPGLYGKKKYMSIMFEPMVFGFLLLAEGLNLNCNKNLSITKDEVKVGQANHSEATMYFASLQVTAWFESHRILPKLILLSGRDARDTENSRSSWRGFPDTNRQTGQSDWRGFGGSWSPHMYTDAFKILFSWMALCIYFWPTVKYILVDNRGPFLIAFSK